MIESTTCPSSRISGGGAVAEGGARQLHHRRRRTGHRDTSINYQVGGTAQAGDDYEALNGHGDDAGRARQQGHA